MEREVLLERVDAREVALLPGLGERLQRLVQPVHVSLVMARVVQLEQFRGIGRRQGVVRITERRQLELDRLCTHQREQKGTVTSIQR
jgi:hypothetical protein